MGSGELAVFFLWWTLRRAINRSILLIEEPETFLSPASQDAIGAHLVATGCDKKLCIVVTTHSAPMIVPMTDESLRFVVRDHRGVGTELNAPTILLRNLGIDPPIQGVLLAEDDLGMEFAKALLERFDPRLARRVDICARGGDGQVAASLRSMPNTSRLRFIGVLDGDINGKVPEDIADRCIHLPGEKPVEILFRDMVMADPQSLADVVGFDRIGAILGGLEGRDHHDWFRELASELGYSRTQLFPFMLTLWLRVAANVAASMVYVEAIQKALETRETNGVSAPELE